MQTSESNFVIYKIKYNFEYCWKRFPFVKFVLIVKMYISAVMYWLSPVIGWCIMLNVGSFLHGWAVKRRKL